MAYYPPTDWELKDFYRQHADMLYRACSFLTCGEADAQAMVADIFLMLLRKGMIFSSDKDAKAWLLLAACKMSKKAPKVQSIPAGATSEPELVLPDVVEEQTEKEETAVAEQEELEEEPADTAAVAEPAEDPEEVLPAGSSQGPFPEELRKLSRKDRLIVLMYYCEGFRKKEIADQLGWPTFRVDGRLRRIKKRILHEKGGEEA